MKTYDWLKQIPSALLQLDSTPLVGFAPPFPWTQFSDSLKVLFQLPSLTIKPADALQWRLEPDLLSGLGDRPVPLQISETTTGGYLCWVMAEQDIASLMTLLLSQQATPSAVIDPDFMQGFYHFIALEALNTISQIDYDHSLSLHIVSHAQMPKEAALCLDILFSIGEKSYAGRLILSPELQKGFKQRFAHRTQDSTLLRSIDLEVRLEAGRTSLTPSALKKLSPGDFVLLDSCSLKPNGNGSVVLSIHGIPLFRGELEENGIKLQEYSLYNEVDMTNNHDETSENPEENLNQPQPPPDESAEAEEAKFEGEEDFEEAEEELDEFDEEFQEEQEKWPPPPESREELEQPLHEEQPIASEAPLEVAVPVTAAPEQPSEGFSLGDIPMSVVVEVGRLQLTIQKLMELQPGNLLELNVRPENGVDLVINGKRIAKGELLLVGETLGVRVLDIG